MDAIDVRALVRALGLGAGIRHFAVEGLILDDMSREWRELQDVVRFSVREMDRGTVPKSFPRVRARRPIAPDMVDHFGLLDPVY
ncbi:MAG: hypothetical protein ACREQY_03600 [Candidatus Binatia bacterium]